MAQVLSPDTARRSVSLTCAVLDGGRQHIGFMLLAKSHPFSGILLQAVVVQDMIVRRRIVVAAHEKS
jgi:hypothetical protein